MLRGKSWQTCLGQERKDESKVPRSNSERSTKQYNKIQISANPKMCINTFHWWVGTKTQIMFPGMKIKSTIYKAQFDTQVTFTQRHQGLGIIVQQQNSCHRFLSRIQLFLVRWTWYHLSLSPSPLTPPPSTTLPVSISHAHKLPQTYKAPLAFTI